MITKSWVVVDGDKPLFETWNKQLADKCNAGTRYKAIPIVEWLHRINMEQRDG